jgi:hypothetical protein
LSAGVFIFRRIWTEMLSGKQSFGARDGRRDWEIHIDVGNRPGMERGHLGSTETDTGNEVAADRGLMPGMEDRQEQRHETLT